MTKWEAARKELAAARAEYADAESALARATSRLNIAERVSRDLFTELKDGAAARCAAR
jgi:hypothetical protein